MNKLIYLAVAGLLSSFQCVAAEQGSVGAEARDAQTSAKTPVYTYAAGALGAVALVGVIINATDGDDVPETPSTTPGTSTIPSTSTATATH